MLIKATSLFLLVVGLFFAIFGVYFIALGYEAEGWAATEGEVVSVVVKVDIDLGVRNPQTGGNRSTIRRYYPSIAYRWSVDGQSYTGDRYRLGETHEKYRERQDAVAAAVKYRNGMPVTVYYDAENPSSAVLDPSLSVGVFVPLPLGLLFLACGWALHRYRPAIEKAMAASQGATKAGSATP